MVSVTEVVSTGQHHPSVWLNATAPGDDTGTQPTEGKKVGLWYHVHLLKVASGCRALPSHGAVPLVV